MLPLGDVDRETLFTCLGPVQNQSPAETGGTVPLLLFLIWGRRRWGLGSGPRKVQMLLSENCTFAQTQRCDMQSWLVPKYPWLPLGVSHWAELPACLPGPPPVQATPQFNPALQATANAFLGPPGGFSFWRSAPSFPGHLPFWFLRFNRFLVV